MSILIRTEQMDALLLSIDKYPDTCSIHLASDDISIWGSRTEDEGVSDSTHSFFIQFQGRPKQSRPWTQPLRILLPIYFKDNGENACLPWHSGGTPLHCPVAKHLIVFAPTKSEPSSQEKLQTDWYFRAPKGSEQVT